MCLLSLILYGACNNFVVVCSESGLNTLWEVREMTDNYAKKIGDSGSGTVYYGKLQTGQEVAVKVWAQRSRHQAAREFSWFQMVRTSPNANYSSFSA